MNILNKFTSRSMKKNRTRTVVTIIGITLSIALMTAVTVFTYSLINYFVNVEKYRTGDWHVGAVDTNINKNEINKSTELKYIGVSKVLDEREIYDFSVISINSSYEKIFDPLLEEGRLPVSSDEITVSTYALDSDRTVKLGDKITLDIENEEGEITRKTFTIVGKTSRSSLMDNYSGSSTTYGRMGLTYDDGGFDSSYSIHYINLNNPKEYVDFIEENIDKNTEKFTNNQLLMYMGISNNTNFNLVISGLMTVVIILIVLGSVSLIYNSFSISINERTKQLGILSSVGATPRQISNSIFYEALVVGSLGILAGIIVGVGGISVTLLLIKGLFRSVLSYPIDLLPHVTLMSILIPVIVGFVTVFISAFIPAIRVSRMPVIDALRQTSDIKMTGRKVRISKLTYKIFGLEGFIARKNFKRNRKKYRSTIVSLALSIILFITANSFVSYLKLATDMSSQNINYDITFNFYNNMNNDRELIDKTNNIVKTMDNENLAKDYSYHFENQSLRLKYDMSVLNSEYFDIPEEYQDYLYLYIRAMPDSQFIYYLKSLKLDEKTYTDTEKITALTLKNDSKYDYDIKKFVDVPMFKSNKFNMDVFKEVFYETPEGSGFTESKLEACGRTIEITTVDNAPELLPLYPSNGGITVIMAQSVFESMLEGLDLEKEISFSKINFVAQDHEKAEERLFKICEENNIDSVNYRIYNHSKSAENDRNLTTLVNVFAYGFIILISLVAITNVFNTISTNIILRRREFAMLKSVGMTEKGFKKMMNYECILYGVKSLLYGLPIAAGFTYFIYNSIINMFEVKYFIPLNSIITVIISVFAVVFITMIYSTKKINKKNIIDTLKNESF